MNLSQRIANRVFENHGQYTVNRQGDIRMAPTPLASGLLRLLGAGVGSFATIATPFYAHAAEQAGNTTQALYYAALSLGSASFVGLMAYDHLIAANLRLPDTIDPNIIETSGREMSDLPARQSDDS